MGTMWKSLDLVEDPPVRLSQEDRANCFYARDYASRKKYDYSESNNLIANFKKDVSKRETNQWPHKIRAIQRFADELTHLFSELQGKVSIAAIPTSKRRDDPLYDSRLDDVLEIVSQRCDVVVKEPLIRRVSVEPAHTSEERPTVEQVYETLMWNGIDSPPNELVLIDDVVTAGTTFKACQRHIHENAPHLKVYGVFWAHTVWPDQQVDLSEFFPPIEE